MLAHALGIRSREHLALVGGGGKTSLLLRLAAELAGAGKRVLTSTTTKVWYREAARTRGVRFLPSGPLWREELRAMAGETGPLFLALRLLESGKVEGVDPDVLDFIFREEVADILIVEADGAAGHPVKAPLPHEPVIPVSATLVVAVMGLEALGRPMGPEIVFRPEEFSRISGVQPGGVLGPAALAGLFHHPEGLFRGAPSSAGKIAFLNKTDLLSRGEEAAEELARQVLGKAQEGLDRVVIGSLTRGEYRVLARNGPAG